MNIFFFLRNFFVIYLCSTAWRMQRLWIAFFSLGWQHNVWNRSWSSTNFWTENCTFKKNIQIHIKKYIVLWKKTRYPFEKIYIMFLFISRLDISISSILSNLYKKMIWSDSNLTENTDRSEKLVVVLFRTFFLKKKRNLEKTT